MFRHLLSRIAEDMLFLALALAALPLLLFAPWPAEGLASLIDWHTLAALAGLMVLSRGLEDSGALAHAGRWMLARVRGERTLAVVLVLFSALLSAVITNDVALFIVVPLTLGLRRVAELPIGRLVIFEALAVNAGSAVSPVGNPQNLFLWQVSGASFVEFLLAMLPLASAMLALLLLAVVLGFPARPIPPAAAAATEEHRRGLLAVSIALYPVFIVAADRGLATYAAPLVVLLFLLFYRRVLAGVDWLLLLVFLLMFLDLGLLANMPLLQGLGAAVERLPGDVFTAGVLLSQLISNVPAAIFLERFATDWRALAWGVSVGGFGLAIGSLANLIALRLAGQRGLWREFHLWSVPALALGILLAMALRWLGPFGQG